jgi:hypothetical protein
MTNLPPEKVLLSMEESQWEQEGNVNFAKAHELARHAPRNGSCQRFTHQLL